MRTRIVASIYFFAELLLLLSLNINLVKFMMYFYVYNNLQKIIKRK